MGIFPWRRPEKPEPAPVPAPAPVPPDADPNSTPWLRVWWQLRSLDMKKVGVALFTIPVIVFFAVSGMVAWLWLILRGFMRFLRSLVS